MYIQEKLRTESNKEGFYQLSSNFSVHEVLDQYN